MKTLKQHLEKQFENLIPYTPILSTEYIAIRRAVKEWLEQERQELEHKYKVTQEIIYPFYLQQLAVYQKLLEKLNQ